MCAVFISCFCVRWLLWQCVHGTSCSLHCIPSIIVSTLTVCVQGLPKFPLVATQLKGWRCRAKLAVRGSPGSPIIGVCAAALMILHFRQRKHTLYGLCRSATPEGLGINSIVHLASCAVMCALCSSVPQVR